MNEVYFNAFVITWAKFSSEVSEMCYDIHIHNKMMGKKLYVDVAT